VVLVVGCCDCEKRRKAGDDGPVRAARAVRSSVRTGAADSCLHGAHAWLWGRAANNKVEAAPACSGCKDSRRRARVKLRPASGGGERETSAALQMGATRCRWAQKPGGRPSQARGWCAVDGSSAAWWRSRFFSPEALELLRLGGWWLVVGGWWLVVGGLAWPAVLLSCWRLDKPCVLPGFGLGDVRLNE
jgi:hypothetical protein